MFMKSDFSSSVSVSNSVGTVYPGTVFEAPSYSSRYCLRTIAEAPAPPSSQSFPDYISA